MRLVQHPTNNDVLRAPPGTSIEECMPAPITRILYEREQMPGVRTYWRPTQQEREAIANGKDVYLEVWGLSMAPAILGVDGVDPA